MMHIRYMWGKLIWELFKRSSSARVLEALHNAQLVEAARQVAAWENAALTQLRSTRDMAVAFRASLENPDLDIRDDLDELIVTLVDSVAQAEEHIVV